jgi:hypothetical protein
MFGLLQVQALVAGGCVAWCVPSVGGDVPVSGCVLFVCCGAPGVLSCWWAGSVVCWVCCVVGGQGLCVVCVHVCVVCEYI